MAPLPFLPPRLWRADQVLFHLPDGTQITYGAVSELSGRFASALSAAGARPGDRIAVQVEKSWQAVALYLACLRAGLVFLPLNPEATGPEVDHVLSDAAPKLLVCAPRTAAQGAPRPMPTLTLGAQGDGTLCIEATLAPPDFREVKADGESLAAILYTSGTTGRPKGAMLSHRALRFGARTLAQLWQFTPDDILLHALPLFHVHGLFIAVNTALAGAASIRLLPRFEVDAVLAALPDSTVMMGVPTHYVRLLRDPRLTDALTRRLRLFVSGSAPLAADTFHGWRARTGHTLLERYGMTETLVIASNPYDGPRREGSVGRPLPGTELRIADQTGAALSPGATGAVEVRGPHLFSGYWSGDRRPESKQSDFRPDGFFVTGDLGLIDPAGDLRLVGRSKDLIVSGGFNVYPKEIEAALDSLPGVLESAVVGVAHPDLGEAVVAVVVKKEGADIDEARILAGLKQQVARYKQPRRVVFVDALPRTTMSKVSKVALRDEYRQLFQG